MAFSCTTDFRCVYKTLVVISNVTSACCISSAIISGFMLSIELLVNVKVMKHDIFIQTMIRCMFLGVLDRNTDCPHRGCKHELF